MLISERKEKSKGLIILLILLELKAVAIISLL